MVTNGLTGGGEMGDRIRAFDWSNTLLGSLENFPQSLRSILRLMLSSKASMAIFWGTDLIQFYNNAYTPLIGAKHPMLLGQPAHEGWRENWAVLKPLLDRVMQTGEGVCVEDQVSRIDRHGYIEEVYFDGFYDPIYDEGGKVGGVFFIARETAKQRVGDRRQTFGHTQADSEPIDLPIDAVMHRRIDAIVSSISDFIYTFDLAGRFTYVNKPLLDLWQKTYAEAIGKNFFELDYPLDLASRLQQQIQQVITTRQPLKDETPYTSASGARAYEYIFVPLFDAAGEVEAVAGTTRDITSRKQIEEALRDSEQQSRSILESISDGFFALDENWQFTYVNQAAETLLGYRPGELIGKTLWEEFPGLAGSEFEQLYRWVVSDRIPLSTTAFYPDHDRWYEVRSYPAAKGITLYFKNVTDRIQLERDREQILRQAQAAREVAEQANRIKDEFLTVLSHELRSPLNPILGWSKLLKMGRLDAAKTAEALNAIERNAKLQAQLIEDLLDVSRIIQGKLTLNVAPVALIPMTVAALETLQLAAEAKQIQIQTVFELASGQVCGDAGRLQQVMWNLLSNAVKFTPANGRIEVRLTQVDDFAQIQVIDTGKGISADFIPYVFEHFLQEDAATTRKFGGLGIGLAIVRQLVELHGGTIAVESAGENQGTTFTVRLPLLRRSIESVEPMKDLLLTEEALPLAGLKILVVDDEPDSRDLIAFVLEQTGADVVALPSAIEAMQSIQRVQPHLLVSDIGMPGMDGYMLIEHIRTQLPFPLCKVRAIALTAYAGEMNQQTAIAAGFQAHLSKPIEPAHIIAEITRLCRRQQET